MLFLDDAKKNIIKAKEAHFSNVSKYLKQHQKPKCDVTQFIHDKDNLKTLICGLPVDIEQLNESFYKNCKGYSIKGYRSFIGLPDYKIGKIISPTKELTKRYKAFHEDIKTIINYEKWFIKSNKHYDYELASLLDMNTCTYCNRSYTHTKKTVDNKKLMRPQFDHWFPKSTYPLLALSFYNLIPSCSICNSSVKGDTKFNLSEFTHPYMTNILDDFKFTYEYWTALNELKIRTKSSNPNIQRTLNGMGTENIYNTNLSELEDLLKLKQAYSKNYIKSLRTIGGINMSENEIYRLAFGTELDSKDFHKRPMSKFKYDILKELEIIKE